MSNEEIAKSIDISPTTVRNVMQRSFAKLDINGKVEPVELVNRSTLTDRR